MAHAHAHVHVHVHAHVDVDVRRAGRVGHPLKTLSTHAPLSESRGASLKRSLVHEARVLEHGVRARLDERKQLGHLVGETVS